MGKPLIAPSKMFDNDNPGDREILIGLLQENGLSAFEWESGGGVCHVSVPLIQVGSPFNVINAVNADLISEVQAALQDSPNNPHFLISTNSLRTSCEVGLMGEDLQGNFIASEEWEHTPSSAKALSIFLNFWNHRDSWIREWLQGNLGGKCADNPV
jgi:hypothetical protein